MWLEQSNTQKCYKVCIGYVTLYFSYNTLIGVRGPDIKIRRENVWGPTTGGHINVYGLRDWPTGSEEQVEQTAKFLLATELSKELFKLQEEQHEQTTVS